MLRLFALMVDVICSSVGWAGIGDGGRASLRGGNSFCKCWHPVKQRHTNKTKMSIDIVLIERKDNEKGGRGQEQF